MAYYLNPQLTKGEAFEQRLCDEVLSADYEIRRVSMADQRRGIDRIIKNRVTGKEETIEIKLDEKAQHTHNAFIETVSVDTTRKLGWAYTCQADVLFYAAIGSGEDLVYVLRPDTIRLKLPVWKALYPTKSALNDGYRTWGVCVPLAELEACAEEVILL